MNELSMIMLALCSLFYYFHLKKAKRVRKLSSFELTMFLLIKLTYLCFAGSYILLFLDRNFG